MGTSTNWLSAMARIEATRCEDALRTADVLFAALRDVQSPVARATAKADASLQAARAGAPLPEAGSSAHGRLLAAAVRAAIHSPEMQAEIARAKAMLTAGPDGRPFDYTGHRRELQQVVANHQSQNPFLTRYVRAATDTPRVSAIYTTLRRALWQWAEFAGLRPGARAIMEVVVELARDEAFPWWLPVPAHEVRRLARLTEGSFTRSVRELLSLAVTRSGREVCIADPQGQPMWPGRVDDATPLRPIAQWVVRYRSGIPWNAKRAAWWINYDLLCDTGRVLPAFVLNLRSLNRPYGSRNRMMGGHPDGRWRIDGDADDWADLQRRLALNGPLPPLGLRAALWEGPLQATHAQQEPSLQQHA